MDESEDAALGDFVDIIQQLQSLSQDLSWHIQHCSDGYSAESLPCDDKNSGKKFKKESAEEEYPNQTSDVDSSECLSNYSEDREAGLSDSLTSMSSASNGCYGSSEKILEFESGRSLNSQHGSKTSIVNSSYNSYTINPAKYLLQRQNESEVELPDGVSNCCSLPDSAQLELLSRIWPRGRSENLSSEFVHSSTGLQDGDVFLMDKDSRSCLRGTKSDGQNRKPSPKLLGNDWILPSPDYATPYDALVGRMEPAKVTVNSIRAERMSHKRSRVLHVSHNLGLANRLGKLEENQRLGPCGAMDLKPKRPTTIALDGSIAQPRAGYNVVDNRGQDFTFTVDKNSNSLLGRVSNKSQERLAGSPASLASSFAGSSNVNGSSAVLTGSLELSGSSRFSGSSRVKPSGIATSPGKPRTVSSGSEANAFETENYTGSCSDFKKSNSSVKKEWLEKRQNWQTRSNFYSHMSSTSSCHSAALNSSDCSRIANVETPNQNAKWKSSFPSVNHEEVERRASGYDNLGEKTTQGDEIRKTNNTESAKAQARNQFFQLPCSRAGSKSGLDGSCNSSLNRPRRAVSTEDSNPVVKHKLDNLHSLPLTQIDSNNRDSENPKFSDRVHMNTTHRHMQTNGYPYNGTNSSAEQNFNLRYLEADSEDFGSEYFGMHKPAGSTLDWSYKWDWESPDNTRQRFLMQQNMPGSSVFDSIDADAAAGLERSPDIIPFPACPRLISIKNRGHKFPGAKICDFIIELSKSDSLFGTMIHKFIECTKASTERNPIRTACNVRQFMDGMKHYLTHRQDKNLNTFVQQECEKMQSCEFLNMDTIIERALHKCVIRPLHTYIYDLFAADYAKTGHLQHFAEGLKFARSKSMAEIGISAELISRQEVSLEVAIRFFQTMKETYSPLKKLENLIGAVSAITNTCQHESVSSACSWNFPGMEVEDLLSILVYIIMIHETLISAEIEMEYIWSFPSFVSFPSFLIGQAIFYLTAFSSAVWIIKNLQKSISTNQRVNNNTTLVCEGVLKIIVPDEKQDTITAQTLPVRPGIVARDVCSMMSYKLGIINPQEFALYSIVEGIEHRLKDSVYVLPPEADDSLSTKPAGSFAYKRIDAKFIWPANLQS